MVMALSVIFFTFTAMYLFILGILSVINMNWYIPTGVIKYIIVCIALTMTFLIIKIAK